MIQRDIAHDSTPYVRTILITILPYIKIYLFKINKKFKKTQNSSLQYSVNHNKIEIESSKIDGIIKKVKINICEV